MCVHFCIGVTQAAPIPHISLPYIRPGRCLLGLAHNSTDIFIVVSAPWAPGDSSLINISIGTFCWPLCLYMLHTIYLPERQEIYPLCCCCCSVRLLIYRKTSAFLEQLVSPKTLISTREHLHIWPCHEALERYQVLRTTLALNVSCLAPPVHPTHHSRHYSLLKHQG